MEGFGHQEQVSYRQVGRRARGQLRKGPAGRNQPETETNGSGGMVQGRSTSSLDNRRTANSSRGSSSTITRDRNKASIPSRFETVLHHGATENDGFGSAAMRFRHSEHDTPGPGKCTSIVPNFLFDPRFLCLHLLTPLCVLIFSNYSSFLSQQMAKTVRLQLLYGIRTSKVQ